MKEFQTTFNSSFWEIYLFAVLKHLRLSVDFSFKSPDFFVKEYGGINIEAATASHAQGSTPEHMKRGARMPHDLNVFNRQAILRISNSIDTKRKKYFESYSTLRHVKDRPFVLAVTAFDSPFAPLACQRAIEAVLLGYYVDEETFLQEGGELKGQYLNSITKDSGSPVFLGIFDTDEFAWLSAVIFSSCASWGKVRALSSDPNPSVFFTVLRYNSKGVAPHVIRASKSQYTESLLDGLRVYHNPAATHKLDMSVFRHPDVFQSYYSEEQQDWAYDYRDGLLLFRSVLTVLRRQSLR